MRRTPQTELGIRALRSVLMMLLLTLWSTYSLTKGSTPPSIPRGYISWSRRFAISIGVIQGGAFPPHGNPLVYSIAVSWLIAITLAVVCSIIFYRVNPTLFSPAPWEQQGKVYERAGIRAFRWVLLHSPLGCINPTIHLGASRADCNRLLRELNVSEAIHWLTGILSATLGVRCLLAGYAAYGYILLLVRIPFDVYPIMLQRWNRGRVQQVLERPQRRTPN